MRALAGLPRAGHDDRWHAPEPLAQRPPIERESVFMLWMIVIHDMNDQALFKNL